MFFYLSLGSSRIKTDIHANHFIKGSRRIKASQDSSILKAKGKKGLFRSGTAAKVARLKQEAEDERERLAEVAEAERQRLAAGTNVCHLF